jgi:hypothetical protein
MPNSFGLTEFEEVGDTGLEPVTPSLSSDFFQPFDAAEKTRRQTDFRAS